MISLARPSLIGFPFGHAPSADIELVSLCALRLQLKPPIEVGGGPAGTRLIVEVTSAQVKRDRLRGEMLGAAAAGWVIVGPGAAGTVDVRMTLQTDDGAIIFVRYNGRLDASQGSQFPDDGLRCASLRDG